MIILENRYRRNSWIGGQYVIISNKSYSDYNNIISILLSFRFQYPRQTSSLLYPVQSKRIRTQEKIITGEGFILL